MESNKNRYSGIVPPIVTPLAEDRTLDVPALHRLIDFCIAGGVSGIFVNGTSGEALRLPESIWQEVTKQTISYVNDRVDVFCGAIDSAPTRVIEKIEYIKKVGGKLAVCTPPFYLTSFGQDEIIRHYEHISLETDLSIAVYNIPETTGVNIDVETYVKLANIKNVVAIKDSSADWQNLQRLIMRFEDIDVAIFNGAEELCACALLFGAQGCIPGLANFFPSLFNDLVTTASEKDVGKSYKIQKQINHVRKSIFVNGCWVSGMKGLLEFTNLGTRIPSSPLLPLTDNEMDDIANILSEANGLLFS